MRPCNLGQSPSDAAKLVSPNPFYDSPFSAQQEASGCSHASLATFCVAPLKKNGPWGTDKKPNVCLIPGDCFLCTFSPLGCLEPLEDVPR